MGKYAGMTVNERLFGAGLLEAFDNCIDGIDDEGAAAILIKVELSPEDAKATVGAIRENPAQYGYPRA